MKTLKLQDPILLCNWLPQPLLLSCLHLNNRELSYCWKIQQ